MAGDWPCFCLYYWCLVLFVVAYVVDVDMLLLLMMLLMLICCWYTDVVDDEIENVLDVVDIAYFVNVNSNNAHVMGSHLHEWWFIGLYLFSKPDQS